MNRRPVRLGGFFVPVARSARMSADGGGVQNPIVASFRASREKVGSGFRNAM
jgi:hypothetical protein